MNDLPRQKLCEIINRYGHSLCDEPLRLEGLLRDFCGQYRREISVIVGALRERVAADLLSSQHTIPLEILFTRLTNRLQDNLGLAENVAQWAVESWALALGVISSATGKTVRPRPQPQKPINTEVETQENVSPPSVPDPFRRENIFQSQPQPLTPNKVKKPPQLTVQYAGFWRRVAAALIDGIILLFPNLIIIGFSGSLFENDPTLFVCTYIFLSNLIGWLYYAIMESSSVQATPGKIAFDSIVTDLSGNRISFGRATKRYFGKFISALIFCLGFLMVGFTEKEQAIHDIISGCLVVKKQ